MKFELIITNNDPQALYLHPEDEKERRVLGLLTEKATTLQVLYLDYPNQETVRHLQIHFGKPDPEDPND